MAAKVTQPTTSDMLIEALTELTDKKGVTIQAIKKFITEKYGADPTKLKHRLKKALEKCIESGLIVRPKGAERKWYVNTPF